MYGFFVIRATRVSYIKQIISLKIGQKFIISDYNWGHIIHELHTRDPYHMTNILLILLYCAHILSSFLAHCNVCKFVSSTTNVLYRGVFKYPMNAHVSVY